MSESINIGSANSYLEGNEIDSKKIIPFVYQPDSMISGVELKLGSGV